MEISGRIIKIKKTKNNIFIIINNYEKIQIVVKPDNYNQTNNLNLGDIISCLIIDDENNNGKYKCKFKTYLLKEILFVSPKKYNNKELIDYNKLKEYSDTKNRVSNYLIEKGYINVNIPTLTDGETSSKATSFETIYSKTHKKMYLRKTMDSFLRILSCNDINKIFSFGHCFRNEYANSKHMPEFEMLSVFTNYMTLEEGIDFSIELLSIILNKQINVKIIDFKNYKKEMNNGFLLIKNFKNEIDSYASINTNGTTNEFKIKYNNITLIHGIMEICDIDEYNSKINQQGKKSNYGELDNLENSILLGAPPCFNLGINIIRSLAIYNECSQKKYNYFPFTRMDLKEGDKKDE